jgi:hypothetical protein
MLILTKLKNVEQHCGLISYTEFHTNCTKNIESMDIKSLMPLRKVQLSLHRFSRHSQPLNKVCEHLLYQILRLFLSNGTNSFGALHPFHLTIRDALSATFFSDQDIGQWENFRSPVIIRVTHHSQNPLE